MRKDKIARYDDQGVFVSYEEPDICPSCKYALLPQELNFATYCDCDDRKHIAISYLCKKCYHPFIAHYALSDEPLPNGHVNAKMLSLEPNRPVPAVFDQRIKTLSPCFVEIYNQASFAESYGLDQIAGIGYRKALEFLIKDYLISQDPNNAEEKAKIEKMELGNCIANKISNDNLKAVASRSTWLGNDQTHYVQRFEEYDINDMKKYIDAAVYWIAMELITKEALAIAPRGH